MTDDRFLLDHTPGPTLPPAPAVLGLRTALAEAAANLLAIPDAALEGPWMWGKEEADVRYGFFRIIEAIESATVVAAEALRVARTRRSPAAEIVSLATPARSDLHGLLAGLDEAILDADPGGGEWTIRQTLGHVVNSQRAYGWFTAWWAVQPPSDAVLRRIPADVSDASGFPDESEETGGSIADIRRRLDDILDLSAGRLAYLDEAGLARAAAWSGIPVTVGFRLGRFSSHLMEHTIQVEKTLAVLGRAPSEVERLVRRIHVALGRLEALIWPLDPDALAIPDASGVTLAQRVGRLADELVRDAGSVRAAVTA